MDGSFEFPFKTNPKERSHKKRQIHVSLETHTLDPICMTDLALDSSENEIESIFCKIMLLERSQLPPCKA